MEVDPVPARDDVRALARYHSPRVDVPVRLNVNESPYPPPDGWREELANALATVEWHRYPDRTARELRMAIAEWHGVRADQVFAANGSNEVLQTLLLTYGGPGRTAVTFEPTYQLHGHIARITGTTVIEGERASDFTLDPGGPATSSRRRSRRSHSSAPRTTRPASSIPLPSSVPSSTRRRDWSSSTRRTPSSPTGPRWS